MDLILALTHLLSYAERTGNLTIRPDSVVTEVLYDKKTQKSTGVRVVDTNTKEVLEFKAKVIFLCASSMASAAILLNSKSDRFSTGLGNDSGELGHNIMDHQLGSGASAKYEGFEINTIPGEDQMASIFHDSEILVGKMQD
jgi:choline dehydrogenase-like flavoprotein